MKTFRKAEDFYGEETHRILDAAAKQWAIDEGVRFAYNVLLHTDCETVDDLIVKFPEIDGVAMRMWLAQEPVEDDLSRMLAICQAVNLDMKIDFGENTDITNYTELVQKITDDQDNLLRRPKE